MAGQYHVCPAWGSDWPSLIFLLLLYILSLLPLDVDVADVVAAAADDVACDVAADVFKCSVVWCLRLPTEGIWLVCNTCFLPPLFVYCEQVFGVFFLWLIYRPHEIWPIYSPFTNMVCVLIDAWYHHSFKSVEGDTENSITTWPWGSVNKADVMSFLLM